ncbi:uncharacterized protein LOC126740934 isoform X2 [Anthonomus grandis grandis]|uniref:uncharacterized protein LOC126740934 isoform X2 n=1 Tax=Anthonomus grandis grandis TaxID=2921223 RepID=UPI002165B134|nr:uncharacterized protein LOC126740934 isoform X2 [Anthonomus grandis grandis]
MSDIGKMALSVNRKDGDIFRDKSNRKKLRLNSVPSQKLPQNICMVCLGAKKKLEWVPEHKQVLCVCPPAQPLHTVISSPNKRSRMSWSQDEKKTLFKGIKGHGDVKKVNSQCRINWAKVITYCRKNECFGNEKELRICWQNMKANAKKVYNCEMVGTKLERKICKYLYGKPQKKAVKANVQTKEESIDTPSSEEEEDEEPDLKMPVLEPEVYTTDTNEEVKEKPDVVKETEDEDSDEYYSISDVEEKFQIRIRPYEAKDVISLLSSDEDQ